MKPPLVALSALAAAVALCTAIAPPTLAQSRFVPGAFEDLVARQLYTDAYDRWHALDTTVASYTALIRQRVAGALRTPLRDRVMYSNEHAVRTWWRRGARPVMMVLGNRTRYPGRDFLLRWDEADRLDAMPYAEPFSPGDDHLLFGWNREDEVGPPGADGRALVHPLSHGADQAYRFRSGDTITVSFPDGRLVRAVALQFIPYRADAFLLTGTLWIDPVSGVLIRAVYRPSVEMDFMHDVDDPGTPGANLALRLMPGVFKPVNLRLNSVFVDYALWEFEHWLPHRARFEVVATAGVLKGKLTVDVSYEIESFTSVSEDPAAAAGHDEAADSAFVAALLAQAGDGYELTDQSVARGKDTRFIVPKDRRLLEMSPELPPPIWEDAPHFATIGEAEDLAGTLAQVPVASYSRTPWAFRYGWGSPEMIRYNRVEGLAAGLEFDAVLGGPHKLLTSASFGLADGKVKARIGLERSTELRRVTVGGFHELRSTDAEAGHFGIGNSLTALVIGRDEGEYYRATGFDMTWRPSEGERESFVLRAYGERQEAVETRAAFAFFEAFDDEWNFAPNLEADEVDEAGTEVTIRSWWGEEPNRVQAGVEWYGQVARNRPVVGEGEAGVAANFLRSSAVARARIPFAGDEWTGWRLGVEAAAGTTWGDAPAQRAWFLGSAATLRGYEPSVMGGSSFLRGRVEVARVFEGVGGSVFYDVGWAGERGEFDGDDLLSAAGLGLTVLDGLVRADIANGLRGPEKRFRFYLYADAIL